MTGDASGDNWKVDSLVEEKTLASESLVLDPGSANIEYVPLGKLSNLLCIHFFICNMCIMIIQ